MEFCSTLTLGAPTWREHAFLEDVPPFSKELCVSGLLVIIFFAFLWLSPWTRSHKEHQARSRAALRALLTVITPSCSLWPSRYTKFVKNSSSIRANDRIALPLDMVIQDVLEGVIEFRDPLIDLVELTDGIQVNGWTVCVYSEWKLWVDAMELWLCHKADRGLGEYAVLGLLTLRVTSKYRHVWMANIKVRDYSPTRRPSGDHINLDCQPLSSIRNVEPGARLTLEFSSLSMGIRPRSVTHVLALLPFILCSRDSCGPLRRPRQLSRVLDMLGALSQATGQGNIVVRSATNMSMLYHQELLRLHERISENGEFRKMLVNAFGIRRWRQQRFCLALEAVLVRRGLIEKWAIEASVE
ncbi:hypothetical protein F5141DRAFT_1215166 [Pisolithus sp. B1]|nr:hypothetical protein F5141DRAFT_1215166 [Pisolithus sp. B1]